MTENTLPNKCHQISGTRRHIFAQLSQEGLWWKRENRCRRNQASVAQSYYHNSTQLPNFYTCTAIVAKRCYLRNCSILCQNLVSRAEIVQFGETGEGAIVIGESNALRMELIRTNWNYLCKNLSHFVRIWKCLIFKIKLAQKETNWNFLQLSIDM